ncbi:hypothetical protein N9J94_02205 [Planktomarina sp.]|nr:hypothetical protein [Planktomarina sp.]MDA9100056.1 hypothetical protein [Planktomarina sp.]
MERFASNELQKLCEQVNGCSLTEVIEEYADPDLDTKPLNSFNKNLTCDFINHLAQSKGKMELEEQLAELLIYCNKNKIEKDHINNYLAYVLWDNFSIIQMSISLGTCLMSDPEDLIDYFFSQAYPKFPDEYVISILFPPINSYGVDKIKYLPHLTEAVFRRLRDKKHFCLLINKYVSENPFFRDYPIKIHTKDLADRKNIMVIKKSGEKKLVSKETKEKEKIIVNESRMKKPVKLQIKSPNRAYFGKSLQMVWNCKSGQSIQKGEVVGRLVGHFQSIDIISACNSIIVKKIVEEGGQVSKSNTPLCEIKTPLQEGKPTHDIKIVEEGGQISKTNTPLRELETPLQEGEPTHGIKNVEERLIELKKLYSKGLISEKNFDKKQAEIIMDL